MASQICSTLLLIYFYSAMPWFCSWHHLLVHLGLSKKMEYLNIIIFPDSNCHHIWSIHHTSSYQVLPGESQTSHGSKMIGPNDHNAMGPHLQCRRVVNAHMECTAFGQLRSTWQFLGGDGHGVTNVLPPSESSVDFEPNMENGSISGFNQWIMDIMGLLISIIHWLNNG